jgi:hypothetical protein
MTLSEDGMADAMERGARSEADADRLGYPLHSTPARPYLNEVGQDQGLRKSVISSLGAHRQPLVPYSPTLIVESLDWQDQFTCKASHAPHPHPPPPTAFQSPIVEVMKAE